MRVRQPDAVCTSQWQKVDAKTRTALKRLVTPLQFRGSTSSPLCCQHAYQLPDEASEFKPASTADSLSLSQLKRLPSQVRVAFVFCLTRGRVTVCANPFRSCLIFSLWVCPDSSSSYDLALNGLSYGFMLLFMLSLDRRSSA
jgi:hypothetical protein